MTAPVPALATERDGNRNMEPAMLDKRQFGRNTTRITAGANGLTIVKHFEGPKQDAKRRYANSLASDRLRVKLGSSFAPPIIDQDDDALVLTFPYIEDSQTLQDLIEGGTDCDVLGDSLAKCGEALGTIHGIALGDVIDLPHVPELNGDALPDALSKFRFLTPDEYAAASGGELECWRVFQHDDELATALENWLQTQRHDPSQTLIHGDLRPDQCLFAADEVHIIDWEEFTIGPPTRDVAGIVGALIFDALVKTFSGEGSLSVIPLDVHKDLLQRGEQLLADARPAIATFIAAYETSSSITLDRLRLGADIGWYLIERVLARSMMSYELFPADKAIAGVGRQALVYPASASEFLGTATESVSK